MKNCKVDSILFRIQRGGLEESMKEATPVTKLEDIREIVPWANGKLTTKYYGYDERVAWDTWIVCNDGQAIGFASGKLE
jgi:hypothetical protein